MWVPLAVLAVLATIGGFVGIGPAFNFITGTDHPGGKLHIVNWLNPIIWDPATREFKTAEGGHGVAENHEAAPVPAGEHGSEQISHGFNLAHAVDNVIHNHTATEWIFIFISLIAAGIGMLLGALFYLWRPGLPDIWAARLRPLYQASYNKYWVDEFYGWAVTRRTMDAARAIYAFDSRVVDGLVNGVATLSRGISRVVGGIDKYFVDGLVNTIAAFIARLMSPLFRAAQTGFAQNYALVMVFGLMLAVGIFFAKDIASALRGIIGGILS
jgi:NADH:ubiquinone oxidoreductase subunit 5 (subunit L)/multisubunit Na+/H+ antiporter MnhA subunit